MRFHRLLSCFSVAAVLATASLWACGGSTADGADTTSDAAAVDGAAPDARADVSDAPLTLPFDAADVHVLRYEEGAYMRGTRTYLAFDLGAGTGTYRNVDRNGPLGADAGEGFDPDAGAGSFSVDSADVTLLRQKLASLSVAALSPQCSGNDGPYKWLFVEGPRPAPIVVSNDYACSGGPVVDVIAGDGFFGLRAELYRIAGLAAPSPY